MSRVRILIGIVCVVCLVVLCGQLLVQLADSLEAAQRRVRLGADEAAVIAAVGRIRATPSAGWTVPAS
jgi:hypothetical protein